MLDICSTNHRKLCKRHVTVFRHFWLEKQSGSMFERSRASSHESIPETQHHTQKNLHFLTQRTSGYSNISTFLNQDTFTSFLKNKSQNKACLSLKWMIIFVLKSWNVKMQNAEKKRKNVFFLVVVLIFFFFLTFHPKLKKY